MTTSTNLQRTLLVIALASIYPLQAHASAGVAQFIAGDVNVRGVDGTTNALVKGRDIESGQAILTGLNGRAQVKFSDGGLVSLQPNTEFKIANYVDKADPQEDRFLVDLLRGSMRAITGLIGKRNRANYKVTTTTATIGIRGSGFSAGYNPDGSLGVTAEKDAIEVCSGGTCVGVVAGESVRVNSSNEPPVRTVNRASVPTPGPAQDVVTVGNQTNADGNSSLITAPVTTEQKGPTGSFTNLQVVTNYNANAGGTTFALSDPAMAATLADGKLTAFKNANASFVPVTAGAASYSGTMAAGDFVGWGIWVTGSKTDLVPTTTSADRLHYVVGIPTPSAQMPITGSASYSLIGSTSPTRADGVSGSLTSATFSANFLTTQIDISLYNNFGASTQVTSDMYVFISGSSFANTANTIKGNFFGTNAARAGLVYSGFDTNVSKYFSGSAVFQK